MKPTETVKALYDAFAAGDIPYILNNVSEDFTWHDPSNPSIVPHGGLHKGKEAFQSFFQRLNDGCKTTLWQVDNYTAEGDTVVAEGKHGITANETGKSAISDWAMVWKFKDGTPIAGRAYYSTSVVEDAFQ